MKNLVFAVCDSGDDFGLNKEPDYSRLGVEYDCSAGIYRDMKTKDP